jgi:RNA polymerase sigma-70 factor (ECF subfamily)
MRDDTSPHVSARALHDRSRVLAPAVMEGAHAHNASGLGDVTRKAPPPRATVPPSAADEDDAVLAAQLAGGDASALDALYRRHRGPVYRFALLWTGSSSVAADVTQEVFLHMLTRAGDYEADRGALQAWLLGIARNFARRRTGVPANDPLDDDADARAADDAPSALDVLIVRDDVERLRRAIAALPPHFRDVLVLVELAERSYAETALICGCELNTVRSRLSRARALLARWLAPGGGPTVPA